MSVPQAPKKSDSLTSWFFTYRRLKFFSRMQRLLHLKAARKQYKPPGKVEKQIVKEVHAEIGLVLQSTMKRSLESHDDWVVILQRSVKRLHFGSWEEKEVAAEDIKGLAKDDLKRRKTMAELGVIPPLVAMAGSEVVTRRRLAIQTLLELANGSFTNKVLMLEAGILSKLPENNGVSGEQPMQEFAELLLSISSALANTRFSISSSRIIPFIIHILESSSSTILTKDSCLTTLYNLSSVLENATTLASSGVVNILLRLSSVKSASEKALSLLGNLVVTLTGEKALESDLLVPERLIEIMTWDEMPKCQELSAYVLMILAYRSSLQRQKMAKAGIVPVLLEVALLGSTLAQKRALKILQWFKNERQMKMGPHSGPQVGGISIGSPLSPREVDEGKKLMKKIVKQSLYKNMETITRRANGEGDASKLKSLANSSSSKSLPD